MPDNYRHNEIQLVLDVGPEHEEDFFRLVITGAATTKHLNVTPAEVEAIRDLLGIADNPGSVNLPTEDPQKWARAQFEFENCEECGGDETNHDIVPVLGNWFARCRTVDEPVTGSGTPEMMEDKGETSTEWYKRVSDEPATGSVKSDEVDRAAAMTLVNDANARGVLAREIWSGNAPADLMVRFRSLSNNAAEYVAYLGYSNGDNDWRDAAGLPATTDDTPEPSADAVKLDPDPGLNALLTEMRDTPEPDDDETVTAFNRLLDALDAVDTDDEERYQNAREACFAYVDAHPEVLPLARDYGLPISPGELPGATDFVTELLTATPDERPELANLLADWLAQACTIISDISGDMRNDWQDAIDKAKSRADVLGIEWDDEFIPGYVRDLLTPTD